MSHISKRVFEQIVEDGTMFKIEDIFYGTINDFVECFWYNVTYQSVIELAEKYNKVVEVYTPDEHKKWI